MAIVCNTSRKVSIAIVAVFFSFLAFGGIAEFCLEQNRRAHVGSVYSYGGNFGLMIKQVLSGDGGVLVGLDRNLERNCHNPGYVFIKTETQGLSDGRAMFAGYFRCTGTFSYCDLNGAQRTIPAFEKLSDVEVAEMQARQAEEEKKAAEEQERRDVAEQPMRKDFAQKAISAIDLVLEKKIYVERGLTLDVMVSVKHFLWKNLLEAKRKQDWLDFLNVAEDIISEHTTKITTYKDRFPNTEVIEKTLARLSGHEFGVVINCSADAHVMKLSSRWLKLKDFCSDKLPSIEVSSYTPFENAGNKLSIMGPPVYIYSEQFARTRIPSRSPFDSFSSGSRRRRNQTASGAGAERTKDLLVVEWSDKQSQVKSHEISADECVAYIKAEFARTQKVLDDMFVPLSRMGAANYSQANETQEALEQYAKDRFSQIRFDIGDNILVEREYLESLNIKIRDKSYEELINLHKQGKWLELMAAIKAAREEKSHEREIIVDDNRIATTGGFFKYPERAVIANFVEVLKEMECKVEISQKKRMPNVCLAVGRYVAGWDSFRADFGQCPKEVVLLPRSPDIIAETRSAVVTVCPNNDTSILLIGHHGHPDPLFDINQAFRPLVEFVMKVEEHEITEAEARKQYEAGCEKIRQQIREKFVFLSGKGMDGDAVNANRGNGVSSNDSAGAETETRLAVEEFNKLVSEGFFSQLEWSMARNRLNRIKGKMKTNEGKSKIADLLYRVNCMELVQNIFISEMPGNKFQKSKLKGFGVVDADKKEMQLVCHGTFTSMDWKTFYHERHGNLNELLTLYVVKGRQNKKFVLDANKWADAMCGAALTLKIICADSSSATAYGDKLLKQVGEKFPEKIKMLTDVFPDNSKKSEIKKAEDDFGQRNSNNGNAASRPMCSRCGGRKYIQVDGSCPTCNGSGRVIIPPKKMITGYSSARSSTCSSCSGKGTKTKSVQCPDCCGR